MYKAAITHKACSNYAFPLDRNNLKIRLKAAKADLKEVKVVYGSRYPEGDQSLGPCKVKRMHLVGSDELHNYFEAILTLKDGRFRYCFLLDDGKEKTWFYENGFSQYRCSNYPFNAEDYFQYPTINEHDIFDLPEWVNDAVFYEIFPDRFFNGNPANDPAEVKSWGDKPQRDSFFGGDLEGISQKLAYLKDLGINAIYLTPIFTSSSNHKYNTDDYFNIDPCFGNLNIAKKLVKKAHSLGIKVVLDAVFNHCGYNFFAFKDVREKGSRSKYIDWFFIKDFPLQTKIPLNYLTFGNNISNMPKLNTSNREVQSYLLDVAGYWLEEVDIDGWRLDVANEVDHQFWRKFRDKVKEIKPTAYILGEIWHNSESWLQGDQFDAVMNYPFRNIILDFFAYRKIGPTLLTNRITKNWMLYQDRVNYNLLNLLDSHDTPRLMHRFSGNKKLLKLAVLFQFTYPGVPMVYYGDEIGLTGGDDPDCRRCMLWDKEEQDIELFNYYKKIIELRHNLLPLRKGDFQSIYLDDAANIYGFKRTYQEEDIFVLFNNSPLYQNIKLEKKVIRKNNLVDYLTNDSFFRKEDKFNITLSPYQGVVLG